MNDHLLIYSQELDHVKVQLTCHAAEDASCRQVASGWDFEDDGKPSFETYHGCLAQEHFDIDPGLIPELQEGRGTTFELAQVPVSVSWDGEQWVWKRETPEESGQVDDQQYLAKVISDGRMIGADFLTIAQRLVQTDLPALGYWQKTFTPDEVAVLQKPLQNFLGRTKALGPSVETTLERELADSLNILLSRMGVRTHAD